MATTTVKLWKVLPKEMYEALMNESEEEPKKETDSVVSMLKVLNPRYADRAEKILEILKVNTSFTWNDHSQVVWKGKTIGSSNLNDILSLSLKNTPTQRFNLPGVLEFAAAVQEANIPRTLFGPSFRKFMEGDLNLENDKKPKKPVPAWITFDEHYRK